ncbi:hypothetical protein [Flavobacterium sp. UMI-01]|uniref:hypothetical protein n=1 Tax=Flavobacterium sp. UMI-01 TaxID=1441053 RepID=UPI001C7CC183|nr:hypothetical protein [Flavobacterium sp. UMI-01]GIZ07335.1 hypothetical protein FUMI01_00620 [Flavobacterium sp. UMI-01]
MTREEEIKLNKVLNKGQIFINFPVIIVMFSFIGIFYYLNKIELISRPIMLVGFVISFLLGWLVWSLFIAKWRIWAFEKIDEKFHAILKEEAIKTKLIWPDGHIFEKTEIRTTEQKLKILAINNRIEELKNTISS